MSHLQSLALISFSFLLCFCNSTDTISSSQQIQDPENLISQNGTFRLGFFSPPNSRFRYVGVLYIVEVNETTPIWVANKNTPLNDSLGSVVIAEDGNLAVLDGQKQVIWSSGVADSRQNTKARILDSGNLVLASNSSDDPIWESFQHPSDSYLQGMELSTSLRSGQNNSLVSWRSRSDPSTGSFKLEVRPLNIPELVLRNGTRSIWRSGPWNGQVFLGVNNMNPVYSSGFTLKDDRQGSVSLTFTYPSTAWLQVYYHLTSDGVLREMSWYEGLLDWVVSWSTNENDCFSYGKCGQFGICDPRNSPICDCLRGYEPLNLGEWSRGIWSGGCRRRSQLQCERSDNDRSKLDGFLKHENVKVPDFTQSILVIDECESECLKNCSCVAYSYSNGIGCMHWTGNLIDIVKFNRSSGADLYVRVAYSELDKKKSMKVVIIITVILVTIGAASVAYFVWICIYRMKGRKQHENRLWFRKKLTASLDGNSTEIMLGNTMNRLEDMHVFEFKKLAAATGDFREASKLGQGGFGPVYKGKLENGGEIAVKRLSRSSGQGLQEFMNEVVVISKLQHRNLVRLLGCCIENNEKILIYEYMPNGSLDSLLFVEQENLDWSIRVNIIEGIARGLLYLHRDSRLKIIHRDLKASNILLDQNLNPKISDFGLARIFGGDQNQANTGRVVGTYGYMSPEYAMEGRFSEKSDVYSFGVLLLEIIGGRRNSSFYYDEKFSSLLSFAWNLWNEEKITDFIDHKIRDPHVEPKILKCIHVGLLCVQEYAQDRPSVSTILSMLCGETSDLPSPNQPAFTERRSNSLDTPYVRTTDRKYSVNGASFSLVEGR